MDARPLLEREREPCGEHGPDRPQLGQWSERLEIEVALAGDKGDGARSAGDQSRCDQERLALATPRRQRIADAHASNESATSRNDSTTTRWSSSLKVL